MSGFAFRKDQHVFYEGISYKFMHHVPDASQTHVFLQSNGYALNLSHETVRNAFHTGAMKQCGRHAADQSRTVGLAQMKLDSRLDEETTRKWDWVKSWRGQSNRKRTISNISDFIRNRLANPTPDAPPHMPPPGGSTLYRWITQFEQGTQSMLDLIPQTANRGCRTPQLDAEQIAVAYEMIDKHYLTQARISVSELHREVKKQVMELNAKSSNQVGLGAPSRQAITRLLARMCPLERDCLRMGHKAAHAKWRQNGSGYVTDRINERWEIDHTVCDIELVSKDGGHVIGRPTLTVVMDTHSRMIMSLVVSFSPPSTDLAMAAVSQAYLPKTDILEKLGLHGDYLASGRCETLVSDNAQEFHSASFKKALETVGCSLTYTPVGKPWYKGKVERLMRTINHEVIHRLPGTTRGSVADRDDKSSPHRKPTLTIEELRRKLWTWVIEEYQKRHHRGLGGTPISAWEASRKRDLQPPPLASDIVKLAFSTHVVRKVTQKGIEFRGLLYHAREIQQVRRRHDNKGTVLVIADPDDAGTIQFCDPSLGNDPRWHIATVRDEQRHLAQGRTWEEFKMFRAFSRNENGNAPIRNAEEEARVMDALCNSKGGLLSKTQGNRKRAAAAIESKQRAEQRRLEREKPAVCGSPEELDEVMNGDDPAELQDVPMKRLKAAGPSSTSNPSAASADDFDPEAWSQQLSRFGKEA